MDCMLSACVLKVFFWQLKDKLKQTRGNPTDKVLYPVTNTKFYLKMMKFVANFEKLVLGS